MNAALVAPARGRVLPEAGELGSKPSPERPRWRLAATVLALAAAAGCGSARVPSGTSDNSGGSLSCLPTAVRVTLSAETIDSEDQEHIMVRLTNVGSRPCKLHGTPGAEFDNGSGASSAVDNQATASPGFVLNSTLRPHDSVTFPMSWEAQGGCEPNHRAPILAVRVSLPGSHVFKSGDVGPISPDQRGYCWVGETTIG